MRNKGAMELSVGTLVTIVLLMAVLGLGIYLVREIFIGSTDAISSINNQVIDEINNIFQKPETKLAIAPSSRSIELKRNDVPKGFAFSVRNDGVDSATFTYEVKAEDISKCGSSFTLSEANSYLLGGSGTFSLARGAKMDLPELVKFSIPENAPPCPIIYRLNIEKDNGPYSSAKIFVTIK